jgi:hypothetical protein
MRAQIDRLPQCAVGPRRGRPPRRRPRSPRRSGRPPRWSAGSGTPRRPPQAGPRGRAAPPRGLRRGRPAAPRPSDLPPAIGGAVCGAPPGRPRRLGGPRRRRGRYPRTGAALVVPLGPARPSSPAWTLRRARRQRAAAQRHRGFVPVVYNGALSTGGRVGEREPPRGSDVTRSSSARCAAPGRCTDARPASTSNSARVGCGPVAPVTSHTW